MASVNITKDSSTVDGQTFTIPAWASVAGRFYTITVITRQSSGVPVDPVLTGSSRSYDLVESEPISSIGKISVFRHLASASPNESTTIDLTSGGTNQQSCIWIVDEHSDLDNGGVNGADNIVQNIGENSGGAGVGTLEVNLPNPFGNASNIAFGAFAQLALSDFTEGSGFTLLAEDTQATTSIAGCTEYKVGEDLAVDISSTVTNQPMAGIAIELKAGLDTFAFTTQPVETVENTAMPDVVVTSSDNTFTGPVTIALVDEPGVTLSGDTEVNAVAGVATFSGLSIDTPGTGYVFRVTAANHNSADSDPFDITLKPATHLFIFVGPSNTQVNNPITPSIVIRARNEENVIDTNFTGAVTVSRLAGTGTLTGSGAESDLIVECVNGIATFSTLQSDVVETGYQLRFTAAGLSAADSAVFDITAGAPPSDPEQGFDFIMSGLPKMRL